MQSELCLNVLKGKWFFFFVFFVFFEIVWKSWFVEKKNIFSPPNFFHQSKETETAFAAETFSNCWMILSKKTNSSTTHLFFLAFSFFQKQHKKESFYELLFLLFQKEEKIPERRKKKNYEKFFWIRHSKFRKSFFNFLYFKKVENLFNKNFFNISPKFWIFCKKKSRFTQTFPKEKGMNLKKFQKKKWFFLRWKIFFRNQKVLFFLFSHTVLKFISYFYLFYHVKKNFQKKFS